MLKVLDLRAAAGRPGRERIDRFGRDLPRPTAATAPPTEAVAAILADVRARGDAALREYTRRFDGAGIDTIRVPESELDAAVAASPADLLDALVVARESITAFQRSTLPKATDYERAGIRIRQQWRPVERAGCYVPGGLAAYPSSVLMTAIPALVAGVDEVALCAPPRADGHVPACVLAAASIAGVREVYRIGGVQAIAALAYGTASVPRADVIVGAGNIHVATAKRLVSGVVGVPSSFAGPSEVVVIADDTTPVDHAAIDVIVQAEHGPDGLAWLVTWSAGAAARINDRIGELVATSARREAIEATLHDGGYAVIVDDAAAAMDVANAIAPEHLELLIADADSLIPQVRNAGAVFAGINSPASAGDYIAGPSHVLPVYGSARFAGALGVFDFLRDQHIIELDRDGLASAAPHIVAIATAEGLDAHAQSVLIRQ
ncbi:MAG: histidinol dehydrogenase [Acidimicrobiales bacterium]